MAPDERRVAWSSSGGGGAGDASPAKRGGPQAPPPTGRVRVRLERQGRGGKVVTVVDNLPGHPERIEEIGRALKARCGAGGTVKGRVVEVQGDHRERVVAVLTELGLAAVKAGG